MTGCLVLLQPRGQPKVWVALQGGAPLAWKSVIPFTYRRILCATRQNAARLLTNV
ncbi:hypothetical protein COCC4DRAFT_32195 [Bipolaris maydis ATCC 48331]|uniref:Uncharacterized protein n=2 Tax=Cochliobolus heterostrophus TaxID=5016 RepID=M2SUY2_COCH5|nr:uncharacterized protein COCC4DRAFT_32195 [Bipolaris maydis ATCC 48331]EMD89175.1 hypothetical protein COCHEDRAFT_1022653 [Bipolaris maydis C5]ENI05106.1 hypothetical protein COCC4DRAFT_32195 [Bipolaris maydis ATCC 48331]